VFTFLDAVDYAYSAADLVISRSGAVTVSELVYYCLPAILVPYPYAYAHQVANAEVLQKLQVASMIRQDELTPAVLQQCIEQYWLDASVRQKVQRAYRDIPVSFKDCGLVKVVEECAA
jgi:UDP-N-acetylglucosamine--N-acetylmuramyl-(pentapeptide) pyrophosphoryl-undecaprenol N-acetylglucosamine transferase